MWADEAPFSCTTARSQRAAISVKADDADSSDSGSSFDRLFTPLDLNGEDYKSISIKLDLLAGRAGREFFFSSESDLRSAGASAKDFSLDESSFDLIAVAEFLVRQEILVDCSKVTHRGNVDVLFRKNFRLKILLDSWYSSLIAVFKASLIFSCIFLPEEQCRDQLFLLACALAICPPISSGVCAPDGRLSARIFR